MSLFFLYRYYPKMTETIIRTTSLISHFFGIIGNAFEILLLIEFYAL